MLLLQIFDKNFLFIFDNFFHPCQVFANGNQLNLLNFILFDSYELKDYVTYF